MKEYSAAVVHFLDRESGKESAMYCYPITKTELIRLDASDQDVLIVQDGEWKGNK